MMNIWHDIDEERIAPEDFVAVIEISKGSKLKYELDKKTGMLILDRILYTSTHYPANYGEQIEPFTLVRCYPIGVIKMIDNGRNDEKIIAIPFNDPTYNTYTDITQLPAHIFEEMCHFFTVYKTLENKETAVDEVLTRDKAVEIIASTIESYKKGFCGKL